MISSRHIEKTSFPSSISLSISLLNTHPSLLRTKAENDKTKKYEKKRKTLKIHSHRLEKSFAKHRARNLTKSVREYDALAFITIPARCRRTGRPADGIPDEFLHPGWDGQLECFERVHGASERMMGNGVYAWGEHAYVVKFTCGAGAWCGHGVCMCTHGRPFFFRTAPLDNKWKN